MSEFVFILVGAALVNNLPLAQFLGLSPILGVSRGVRTAVVLALATACVLTASVAINQLAYAYLLRPFGLEYLRTLAFMLVIVALAPVTEYALRRVGATLYAVPSSVSPFIVVNSALLGVALLNAQASRGLFESALYGFGGAMGISLMLILFTAMRERIATAEVPAHFKGSAVELITLGLMSLAFMGLAGLGN